MSQVKCPDCGELYSEELQSCPNCGCPTKAKSKSKKIIIIFGKAILCIVAASLYCRMDDGLFELYSDLIKANQLVCTATPQKETDNME